MPDAPAGEPSPTLTAQRPVARAYDQYVKALFAQQRAGEAARLAGRQWAAPDIVLAPAGREHRVEWEAASAPHARAMWKAATDALAAYAHASNWPGGSAPREAMPAEVAFFVAGALRDLVVTGNMPASLEALRRRSGAFSPALQEDKRRAVLYVRAVHRGLLPGKRPRDTIATRFGVTPRAIDRWNQATSNTDADPATLNVSLSTREGRESFILQTKVAAEHWRAFRFVRDR